MFLLRSVIFPGKPKPRLYLFSPGPLPAISSYLMGGKVSELVLGDDHRLLYTNKEHFDANANGGVVHTALGGQSTNERRHYK